MAEKSGATTSSVLADRDYQELITTSTTTKNYQPLLDAARVAAPLWVARLVKAIDRSWIPQDSRDSEWLVQIRPLAYRCDERSLESHGVERARGFRRILDRWGRPRLDTLHCYEGRLILYHNGDPGFNNEGVIRSFNLPSMEEASRFKLPHRADRTAVSYDGRLLAVSGWELGLSIWDLIAGEHRLKLPIGNSKGSVASLCFSPDGGKLAHTVDNTIYVWDLKSAQFVQKLCDHVSAVAWCSNHSLVYSGSGKLTTIGSDLIYEFGSVPLDHKKVVSLLVSSTGQRFVASACSQQISLWKNTEPELPLQPAPTLLSTYISEADEGKPGLAFSRDETLLACSHYLNEGRVDLFNTTDGSLCRTLSGSWLRPVDGITFDARALIIGAGETLYATPVRENENISVSLSELRRAIHVHPGAWTSKSTEKVKEALLKGWLDVNEKAWIELLSAIADSFCH